MLDIILIAIIVLTAFWGFKRGTVAVALSLASYVIAAICARIYSSALSRWLMEETPLGDLINSSVEKKLLKDLSLKTEGGILSSISKISESIQDIAPLALKMTEYILVIVSAIIIFIIVKSIINIIAAVITKGMDITIVLGGINRIIGFFLGGILGMIICLIIATLLVPVSLYFNLDSLNAAAKNSMVMDYIYKYILSGTLLKNMDDILGTYFKW